MSQCAAKTQNTATCHVVVFWGLAAPAFTKEFLGVKLA